MQGSLDAPPIVVRAVQWKFQLNLLFGVAFLIVSVAIVRDARDLLTSIVGWGSAGLACCFIVYCTSQILRPGRLVLSPDGLLQDIVWRTKRYAWQDVAGFRTYLAPAGRGSVTKKVGFDFSPDYPGQRTIRNVTHEMGFPEGGLDDNWELEADALCALLNAARAKWGGASAADNGVTVQSAAPAASGP